MNTKKTLFLAVACLFSTLGFAQSNNRGIDLYRAELYDAAKIELLKQTNLSQKQQAENYYYLGQTYYQLQKVDSASYYYKKSQEADLKYPFGLIGEGKVALDNNNTKEADALFKKALSLSKKDVTVPTAIAEAYMEKKMYENADEALERAKKINKKYPGIYNVLGDREAANGKIGEAIGWYENAINFDPTDKESYLKVARFYKNMNPTEALKYLDKILENDPYYIPAFAEIGDINYKAGNYKSALDAYENFITIPGVPQKQITNYAELLYFTKQYDKAIEKINEILKKDPNAIIMKRLLAYSNYELKNNEVAIQQLNNFLAEAPQDIHIYEDYMNLGRLYVRVKNHEAAIEAYLKAEKMERTNLADVYKEITAPYEGLKNYPVAISYYQKFFAMEDVNPTAIDYFNYGLAWYSEANRFAAPENEDQETFLSAVKSGEEAFDKVIELTPESYLGYLFKARINSFVDNKQFKTTEKMDGVAVEPYTKALEILIEKNDEKGSRNNDIIEAYNYLGSFHSLAGHTAEAGEFFKKILEIDPENPALESRREAARRNLDALGIKY